MAFTDAPRPSSEAPNFGHTSAWAGPTGFAGAEGAETIMTVSGSGNADLHRPQGMDGYDLFTNPFLPPEDVTSPAEPVEETPMETVGDAADEIETYDDTASAEGVAAADEDTTDAHETTVTRPERTTTGVGEVATKSAVKPGAGTGNEGSATTEGAEPGGQEQQETDGPLDPEEVPPTIAEAGFGEFLRWSRRYSGMTQAELAQSLGQTSAKVIAIIESGESYPNPGKVELALRNLGMPDDEIVEAMEGYVAERELVLAERAQDGAEGQSEDDSPAPLNENQLIVGTLVKKGLTVADLTPKHPGRRGMHPLTPPMLIPELAEGKTYARIAKDTGMSVSAVIRNTQAIIEYVRSTPELAEQLPPDIREAGARRRRTTEDNGYRGVGHQLRNRGRDQGLSYSEIAKEVGVSVDTLFRLHNGKTKPAPWVVEKYAQAVGMSDAEVKQEMDNYIVEYAERRARPDTSLRHLRNRRAEAAEKMNGTAQGQRRTKGTNET